MDYQKKLENLISKLKNYKAKNKKKNRREKKVLESAVKLFYVWEDIIGIFQKETFPYKGNVFKTKEEESEENKLEKKEDDYKNFSKYIEDESKGISYELFEEHFNFT